MFSNLPNQPIVKFVACLFVAAFAYYLLVDALYNFYIIPQQFTVKNVKLKPYGKVIEAGILCFFFLSAFIISKRYVFSFVLVAILYLIFMASNVIKIIHLGNPIFPVDFKQLDDLIRTKEVFFQFVPYIAVTIILFFIMVRKLLRWTKKERSSLKRNAIIIPLLITPALLLATQPLTVESFLRSKAVFLKINSDQVKKSIQSGMLNYFLQSVFLSSNYPTPKNYNRNEISSITQKHQLHTTSSLANSSQPSNIILILVESLTDPKSIGWKTTKDPLQVFNSHRKKHDDIALISPVIGGKSINAEFESLTGMSCVLTPPGSLPFREAVTRKVPSIPNELKKHQYHSTAIQQVKMNGFGYERIFEYLGFDQAISMEKYTDIEKDHRNRYSSVNELFKEIIKTTDSHDKNFIYAFSNTTHSPWYESDFPNSTLKLLETEAVSASGRESINGYINALKDFDFALKKLIQHYEKHDERTLIVIVGDHQPHLLEYRKKNSSDDDSYVDLVLQDHSVPVLIWTNYPTEFPSTKLYSMNFLPAILLELAGIKPQGFLKLLTEMKKTSPVFSKIMYKSGALIKNNKRSYEPIHRDYELMQYDVLFGENHQKH